MKKLIIVLLVLFVSSVSSNAQSGLGIKAGLNFNTMSDLEYGNIKEDIFKKNTGFHVGVLYKFDLALGFVIQPELLYTQKGGTIDMSKLESGVKDIDMKSHYLQLPVNIQWGLNLMLIRPFVMVTPYLNYHISSDNDADFIKWDQKKLGYGVGLGAGMDIWKFQITGRYNWDLGNASKFEWDGLQTVKGGKNRSFELSLAFLF